MKISWALFTTGLTTVCWGLMSLSGGASTPTNQLMVFGDSLSDMGNLYNLSRGRIPASPPYVNGRFSNGPVWVENIAQQLNLSLTLITNLPLTSLTIPPDGINFAFGGATSGSTNTTNISFPSLPQQISGYLKRLNGQPANPQALYTVWIGGNDYIGTTPQGLAIAGQKVNQTISNISVALESLIQVGAQDILVFNLPDLGKTPAGQTSNPIYLSGVSRLHNYRLGQLVALLNQKYPNAHLKVVDVYALTTAVIQNPAAYGFTNVTTPCLNTTTLVVCSNPDEYLFWDDLHPTRVGHQLIANVVSQVLATPQARQFTLSPTQIGLRESVHRFPQTWIGLGTGR